MSLPEKNSDFESRTCEKSKELYERFIYARLASSLRTIPERLLYLRSNRLSIELLLERNRISPTRKLGHVRDIIMCKHILP